MRFFLYFLFSVQLLALVALAQQYRPFDGVGVHPSDPLWGSAFSPYVRAGGTFYADSISEPAGASRPNARLISNQLFSRDGVLTPHAHNTMHTFFGMMLGGSFILLFQKTSEDKNIFFFFFYIPI